MIFILTALTNEGKVFIPSHYSNDILNYSKRSVHFQCAECREKVILRLGNIKVPHFAHYRNSSCAHSFSEGESQDHLNGKIQLYDFLERLKIPCELEPYLQDIKQRPDILVQAHEKVALEFQCSKITPDVIRKRNLGYQNSNIQPLWIIKTPDLADFPSKSIGSMKIAPFQLELILSTKAYGSTLITFCPQTKSFSYLSNFLHTYSNNFVVKLNKLPINLQTWPLAMVKKITEEEFQDYLIIYNKKRLKRLNNLYLYNRKGIQSEFLKVCYRWRIHPQQVPLFIGIPSLEAEAFLEHSCEWQLQLIDFLQVNKIALNSVSVHHYSSFLATSRWRKSGQIEKRIQAIQAYIDVIQECLVQRDKNISDSTFNYPKMYKILYQHFLAKGAEN